MVRRIVRGAIIALGAALALLVAAVAGILLFVDFDTLIAKHKDRAVASASAAMGRPVQVREVETSWWPFGIEARGLSIEGLGHADALQLEVSIWDIVKSLGKDVRIDSIVLSHPVVEIVRDESGRFSFADIVEHIERRPKQPMDPKTVEMLQRASIDRIAIENGTVTLVDHAAPNGTGLFFVDDIDAALEDVALGAPAKLVADMGVLSQSQNVSLRGRTGPLPETPDFEALPELLQATLRMKAVPLRSVRLWLPQDTSISVMDSELSLALELLEDGNLSGESSITEIVAGDGKPRKLQLALEGSGGSGGLEIEQARLAFGDAVIDAHGRIDPKNVALAFDSEPIDLAALGLVKEGPASFEARGRVTGPLADARGQAIRIESFRFESAHNAIAGSGLVDGLAKPRITFDARSSNLDVDALRAMFAPEPNRGEPKQMDPGLTVDGTIVATAGRVSGISFRALDARVLLKDGDLVIQTGTADTYGGRLIADGTRIDLDQAPLGFRLSVRLVAIDAAGWFTDASTLGRVLDGTMDAKLDLAARGTTWPDIAATLDGEIGVHVTGGRFEGVNIVRSVVEPLAASLPFIDRRLRLELPDDRATHFRELGGTFYVEEGLLRSRKPLRVQTDHGTIFFTGSIGLDRKLALQGRFELSPDLIAKLTQGRVEPAGSIPVGVGLGCTLLSPCITGVDVEHAVESLVAMEAKRMLPGVKEEARKRLEDVLGL